jgi:hypothetical protein
MGDSNLWGSFYGWQNIEISFHIWFTNESREAHFEMEINYNKLGLINADSSRLRLNVSQLRTLKKGTAATAATSAIYSDRNSTSTCSFNNWKIRCKNMESPFLIWP